MNSNTLKIETPYEGAPVVDSPASAQGNPSPDTRDAQGRFARGNPGGTGNPFARQVAALRSALVQAVTPDDIREIAEKLLLQAKAGNLAAIKLLLSYTLGKPGPAASPDAVELDEWRLRQQAPTAAEMQETVCERREPGLVNAVARALAVVQQQELLELVHPGQSDEVLSGGPTPVVTPGHPEQHGERATGHPQSGAGPAGPDTVNNRGCGRPGEEWAALLRVFDAPLRVPADQFPLPQWPATATGREPDRPAG